MSTLRQASEQYLQLRRDLGCKLSGVSCLLQNFVAFAEREGASHVTTDLALRWAQQPSSVQPVTWAARLRVVRRFAVWLSASDRRTEVPPPGLLACRYVRNRTQIYSDAEIRDLVEAAGRLPSVARLKGQTYSTIFGLLAATGLRVPQLVSVDRE